MVLCFEGCPGPGSSWRNLATSPASKEAESPSIMVLLENGQGEHRQAGGRGDDYESKTVSVQSIGIELGWIGTSLGDIILLSLLFEEL